MQWLTRMVEWGTDVALRRRWIPLGLFALLLAAACAGFVVRGLRADFSPQALFSTFEDQQAIDAAFVERFGKSDNVFIVLVEAPDVLADDTLAWMHRAASALGDRADLERVESPTRTGLPRRVGADELRVDNPVAGDTVEPAEAAALREALSTSSLWDRRLVSEADASGHRSTAVVAFYVRRDQTDVERNRPMDRALAAWLAANPPPAGVTARLAGLPHIRVWVIDQFFHDQTRLVPLSMMLCSLFLFLSFRWWPGIVFPTLAVAASSAMLLGAMAWVGQPINIINQILPVLLMVVGVSDGIHVVSRYMEEHAAVGDRIEAGRRAALAVVVACGLTAVTSSVGFASNIVSHTEILRNFSVLAALGAMLAYIVTVLFLPPVLTLAPAPSARSHAARRDGLIEKVVVAMMGFGLRRPRTVIALTVLLIAPAAWAARDVPVNTHLLETFRPGDEIHDTTLTLERELGGAVPFELHLASTVPGRFDDAELLTAVTGMQGWLGAQRGVITSTSYADYLRETWVAWSGDPAVRERPFASTAQVASLAGLLEGARPNPLTSWVSLDRTDLRINVSVEDIGSHAAQALGADIRAEFARRFAAWPDVSLALTGDAYSGSRGLESLIRDLMGSMFLASIVIFGFMALLFRSVRMGLISAPPNMLPLIWTLGYMSLRDINLNTTSVIIFSIAVGLAVDDTIHVLARLLEEVREGHSKEEAILRTARGTGRAILFTSLMLAAGMSVLFASSFVPVRLFGELMTVTVLGCILGDLFLLPALLSLFWKPDPKHRASRAVHA
jgi:predicted RND superfamily exporter protein